MDQIDREVTYNRRQAIALGLTDEEFYKRRVFPTTHKNENGEIFFKSLLFAPNRTKAESYDRVHACTPLTYLSLHRHSWVDWAYCRWLFSFLKKEISSIKQYQPITDKIKIHETSKYLFLPG